MQFGLLKTLQSWVSVITILFSFGLSTSILILCADGRSIEQAGILLSQVIFWLSKAAILFLIIGIIVWKYYFNTKYHIAIFIYFFTIYFNAVIQIYQSFMLATGLLKKSALIGLICVPFGLLLTVMLSYCWKFNGYLFGCVFTQVTVVICYSWVLKPHLSIKNLAKKVDWEQKKSLFHIGKYSVLANSISILIANIDILIISSLIKNKQDVGYYGFASLIITFIMLYNSLYQQYILPNLTRVAKIKLKWEAQIKRLFIINSIFTVLILIICASLIKPIISYLYPTFINALSIFFILLLAWVVRSIYSTFSIAFLSIRLAKYNMLTSLTMLVVNIICISITAYYFNIKGVAYAQLFTQFFAFLVVVILFNRVRKTGVV